jgi:hypothetical protein
VAVGINLWRGSVFGCGCFGRGVSDQPLSWLQLVRNAGLILLTGLALAAHQKMQGRTLSARSHGERFSAPAD